MVTATGQVQEFRCKTFAVCIPERCKNPMGNLIHQHASISEISGLGRLKFTIDLSGLGLAHPALVLFAMLKGI